MARALLAALLLANLAFFTWSQGWLDPVVGVRSTGDREPERLQRQLRPELIRILPASAASAVAATPAALACFEAGPFADAGVAAAQAAVQAALPPGSWTTVRTEQPGTWLVYMGRYASREALTKKAEELRRRNAPFDEVLEPPALAPGLALGRFEQRAAAAAALDQLAQRGIQTARVVELVPPTGRHLLRVEPANAALSAQLAGLKDEALGAGFRPCARPAGG